MSVAKASSAAKLDTRTGTRVAAATESIAYDAAWGEAASGSLTINGAAVSGLSSSGTYTWTPNKSVTNFWKLVYKAGTINYSATFRSDTYYVTFNANGGNGSMDQIACKYNQDGVLTANSFTRSGYAFVGWMTSANGTTVAYRNGQTIKNLTNLTGGALNLYAKWTDKWYVNAAIGNDTNDGDSAAKPFKTIQHAIDLAVPGMTIVVADGTYAPINSKNKSITIRSVNGAAKTIIDGGYPATTNRCVYAGGNDGQTNTVIRGFTIQNGCTFGLEAKNGAGVAGGTLYDCVIKSNHGVNVGGGVAHSVLFNCTISNNETLQGGGGAYRGILTDCLLANNSSGGDGAGAYGGVLNNCTVISNRANRSGGGLAICVSRNCTIYGNVCNGSGGGTCTWGAWRDGDGPSVGTNFNCIVYGNTASYDNDIAPNVPSFNCCTNDPHFIRAEAGDFRLRYDSPCINAGDNAYVTTVVDCAGNPRIVGGTVDIGAYEYAGGGDEPEGYLVVDLSGGVNATNYPVSYLASVPSGGWTDEYKTSKLVLRAIAPGTFTMGSPEGETGRQGDENPHQVTLTHSYYIGVFELTQRQWELVMGTRPSAFSNTVAYATRPVESISFNQIRGANLGSYWPQMNTVDETSFMGKLRAKTGRLFDLPTEAQWEYACRAGTTTALNSGKNLIAVYGVDANMNEVGRYYYTSGAFDSSYELNDTDVKGTAKVGSYLPNAWGLYDMHGNVGEVCLDWYRKTNANAETDPIGPETGSARSVRGGTWGNFAYLCRSAVRGDWFASQPSASSEGKGLRPVINLANFSRNQVVNLQATDGTDPEGIRLTWTAVPGAEKYVWYRSETPNYADAVGVDFATTNSYLWRVSSTNTYWFWVRAIFDGSKYQWISASDSGYRPQFQLTVANGTGSTNCFANVSVPIVANAAPTGYSFKEWTGVAADVALVANKTAASTTIKMPARAVTLTATYQPNSYTVKFNANGGAGTMANESFTYDTAKALTANAFTRTGYTYQGWATMVAGAKVYADKQSVSNLTATANGVVNLYAVWKANTYTVKFNANGGTGTMANESFTYDAGKALTANAFSRVGYTYQGWATTAAGAKAYSNQQTVSNLTVTANGTVNLYAVWTANPYTVTFDANGGEGAAMAAQNFAYGTAQKLSNVGYTKTGYTFVGWSTDKNAKSATYANGASVSNLATSGAKTLYAVWRANVYAIRFLPNGADGTMADQEVAFDTVTNLTANAFTKEGQSFVGWCAEGETTVSYTNRQEVVNLATNDGAVVTLVAKWTDKWYVDATTGDDANEGASAELAFKTIQRAIDRSEAGQTIIVADGTYAPIITDNKSITIESVNGAAKTVIDGGYPTVTNRCVYAGATDYKTNTVIRGFTIQNGCTVGFVSDMNGAGVVGGTLYDCVVRNNHGGQVGGGAAHSVMSNCTIANNETAHYGGGVYNGLLNNCYVFCNSGTNGGGAYGCVLNNCVISNNVAFGYGGGAHHAVIADCLITGNSGMRGGGGVCHSEVRGSVIAENLSAIGQEGYGGGAFGGVLENCLVYGNQIVGSKGNGSGLSVSVARNCTITGNVGGSLGVHAWLVDGLPGGTNYNCIVYGNDGSTQIDTRMVSLNCCTSDPHFVDAAAGDFRLRYDSPCIDAGDNAYVTTVVDCAGNPRIVGGTVDIGAYEYAGAGDEPEGYLVVDLSGGVNATNYPVSYLASVPAGGWTDEYKTEKLVLRWIGPGTFTMGCRSSDFSDGMWGIDEGLHEVTLTKGFWMGVFEMTQRQWELVMGSNPSYIYTPSRYASRPVEQVSYDMIRGPVLGAGWPVSSRVDEASFLGVLRKKTGGAFDLPTEAQWEYACRAGTTTAINSGKNLQNPSFDSELNAVGRYWANDGGSWYLNEESFSNSESGGTGNVGSYLPNAWGLYDMHGNVREWCLDRYGAYSVSAVCDPLGSAIGNTRVLRGGGYEDFADDCRSGKRMSASSASRSSLCGFRLCCSAEGGKAEVVTNGAVLSYTPPGKAGHVYSVPHEWFVSAGLATYGEGATWLAARLAAPFSPDYTGWEAFVAGLTATNKIFRAEITIGKDGVPQVSWVPNLNEGMTEKRIYRIKGCTSLGAADWSWPAENGRHRFFKVEVGMPEGVDVSDKPGKIGD